jgi:HEAT repeat protein
MLFVIFLVGFVFVGAYLISSHFYTPPPAPVASDRIARVQAILSVPNVAPVPTGKAVSEMTNQEVLGVLVADSASDMAVLEALSEGRSRNITGFLEAAIYKLNHDSYLVRIETIKAIMQHGDKRAVPRLVETLGDHDPLVRAYAAEAIGQLGSRAALSYLLNRYQLEADQRVKLALKNSIEKINGFPMSNP